MLTTIRNLLIQNAYPETAASMKRFFKNAENDQFLGVSVPFLRKVAKTHKNLVLSDLLLLLQSPLHEERLLALLIWTYQFPSADLKEKKKILQAYLKHFRYVNQWDLVDSSAPVLLSGADELALEWAISSNLWKRRASILSTWSYIKQKRFSLTFRIAEMLLSDKEDLIHKVVGWMLREVGKRDSLELEKFLTKHYSCLPRTALRYAIERFPEAKRKAFLKGLM